MASKLPLKPLTMKTAGAVAWTEIIRATASVAEDVGRKALPTWMKVGAGAIVSIASVAGFGVVYALLKGKPTVSTRRPTQSRAKPELESTWRAIFQQLGELASSHKVPIGIVRRFATNTYRGTSLHLPNSKENLSKLLPSSGITIDSVEMGISEQNQSVAGILPPVSLHSLFCSFSRPGGPPTPNSIPCQIDS